MHPLLVQQQQHAALHNCKHDCFTVMATEAVNQAYPARSRKNILLHMTFRAATARRWSQGSNPRTHTCP